MRTPYFAYGSNMDEQDMRGRCPGSRPLGSARLDGHRLAFTRRSIRSATGVADVLPTPGHTVWGAVYELDEDEFEVLDRKEGVGWAYVREQKRVTLIADGSVRDAVVYTVLDKEPEEVPPSRAYLDRLIAAATRLGLPHAYVVDLQAVVVDRGARVGTLDAADSELPDQGGRLVKPSDF
jgi:gamma-glutamylcyclotransferase (GGCT)/AIG2-like uncharacterized protein YtfP